MEKTLIVGSPNLEGNIGSCEVKSTEYKKTFFSRETTAVNSCTGEIVSKTEYFSLGGLWVLFWILVFVLILKVSSE